MKNILIADAGSTKIDWVLLSQTGDAETRITSHGVNALLSDSEDIKAAFTKAAQDLGQEESLDEIYYYGSGCATPEICDKLHKVISEVWQAGSVSVNSDLLGAARSLFGDEKGVACILGTGSNSCLYDGVEIKSNVPSLGFILGDEGSGAALGKRLVSDAFKGHLPKPVRDRFLKMYEFSMADVLDYTYRRPAANRFLASVVPFIQSHLWNPYVYSIVIEEFTSFFKRNIAMYPGAHTLPLRFTGSIAWHFADILKEAADRLGYKVDKITKSPLDGLIEFHNTHKCY